MDLAQAQQLQDLARLGVHVIDAADADDEGQLALRLHVEAALALGLPLQPDEILLLRPQDNSHDRVVVLFALLGL